MSLCSDHVGSELRFIRASKGDVGDNSIVAIRYMQERVWVQDGTAAVKVVEAGSDVICRGTFSLPSVTCQTTSPQSLNRLHVDAIDTIETRLYPPCPFSMD